MQREIARRSYRKKDRDPNRKADLFGFRLRSKCGNHRITAAIVGQREGDLVLIDRQGRFRRVSFPDLLAGYLFADSSPCGIRLKKLDKKNKK